jgi:hypothetical protein
MACRTIATPINKTKDREPFFVCENKYAESKMLNVTVEKKRKLVSAKMI